MKILVSGGGTGGHINPALAIANMYRDENKNNIIEYVGTQKGLETILVPKENYKIHYVDVSGFKRKLTLENVKVAIKAITSVGEAKKIIKDFKPDVVIGTGGYVCWPVLKAASKMKIPTFIHEQNAFPGLTVKKLSKIVDKVLISYEETKEFLDKKDNLVLTGNPIKPIILKLNREEERKKINLADNSTMLLSFGGSLGAGKINENVFELVKNYSLNEKIIHFHATGSREWERYKRKYIELGFTENNDKVLKKNNVTISEYIFDMPQKLSAADIVICRAGAMTISELAVCEKAAIIIPSPNVTNNHQFKNAKVLSDSEACIMIEETKLSYETLKSYVEMLYKDIEKRKKIEKNIKKFAIYDSLYRIHKAIDDVMKK